MSLYHPKQVSKRSPLQNRALLPLAKVAKPFLGWAPLRAKSFTSPGSHSLHLSRLVPQRSHSFTIKKIVREQPKSWGTSSLNNYISVRNYQENKQNRVRFNSPTGTNWQVRKHFSPTSFSEKKFQSKLIALSKNRFFPANKGLISIPPISTEIYRSYTLPSKVKRDSIKIRSNQVGLNYISPFSLQKQSTASMYYFSPQTRQIRKIDSHGDQSLSVLHKYPQKITSIVSLSKKNLKFPHSSFFSQISRLQQRGKSRERNSFLGFLHRNTAFFSRLSLNSGMKLHHENIIGHLSTSPYKITRFLEKRNANTKVSQKKDLPSKERSIVSSRFSEINLSRSIFLSTFSDQQQNRNSSSSSKPEIRFEGGIHINVQSARLEETEIANLGEEIVRHLKQRMEEVQEEDFFARGYPRSDFP